ncbi:MAG: TonB-dependent receptor [Acidobacteria bacterium]|nr:TonB-dependent receptor [Acidobacteriota bacterium]
MARSKGVIFIFFLLAVVFAGVFASSGYAQAPTGNIRGVVTDPTGAVVPKATVKVTDMRTSQVTEMQTDDSGQWQARQRLPGSYKVRVEASGFTPVELMVDVLAGQTRDADVGLKLATAGATVEVISVAGAQVDTTRATVDGVITAQQIDQLPLNARNFLELAALEPGVQVRDGGNIDPTKEKAYRTVGISGRGGTGTRVQIDGIDVTDETVGTTVANLSDDAVQEFQLSRSNLDLSTSLTSSGAVNIITRSGSNDYHGSGFYFFRNQNMGARLQFLDEQPFKRHQVGYRAGGPFIKDKLFWFSNWEGTYQAEQGVYIGDPKFPTVPFGSSNNCVNGCSSGIPLDIRMINERVDWNVRPNMRAFYRFGWDSNKVSGGTVPVSPFSNVNWTISHVGGLDWTMGKWTSSYRFGYVNFNNRIVSQSFGGFPFPTTPQGAAYNLSISGFLLGPNGLAPQETDQDNFQNKYDGSYVWGKHTFRFGGEINHIILGGYANFAGPLSLAGNYDPATGPGTINAQIIARGGNVQNPLEWPLLDFSTGPDNGFFTLGACHGFKYGCHKNTRYAWYVGDTWRAARNVTINLGVRWEYDSGYFNDESQVKRPAYLDFWGKGIATSPKPPKTNFGPQFGFAWDPMSRGKTSIRGGIYMAYEMNIFNNLLFDQNALIPAGIGPDVYGSSFVGQPNGNPIGPGTGTVPAFGALPAAIQAVCSAATLATGDWSCLTNTTLSMTQVLPVIGALNATVKSIYSTYAFSPTSGPIQFETSQGVTFGFLFGGSKFKVPYSVQSNIGVQHEIFPGHVISADFVVNHAVGLPFLGEELECRRCASTLNVAAATAKVNSVLAAAGVPTVAAYIAAFPTRTITSFGLASDSIYRGLTPDPTSTFPIIQTTNFLRARIMTHGGYSKYKALQVKATGHLKDKLWFIKNMNYIVSWSFGRSEATNGAGRAEFLNNANNKLNSLDRDNFGPTGLDRTHIISSGIILDVPFGFRFSPAWRFSTPTPISLFIPAIGITGSNSLFTTDRRGVGGAGTTPNATVLPGTRIGALGRSIKNWSELNSIIQNYNTTVAGTITPAGQALVTAGLFTQAQLISLKAVSPTIALVPTTNPWPLENIFNMDLGITRPIKLSKIKEGLVVEPWLQVFNLFNTTGYGGYGGLGGGFGSLNYNYATTADIQQLTASRGRMTDTRLMQIGVRVSF